MKWNEPKFGKESKLYLPALQTEKIIDYKSIEVAPSNFHITVNESFLDVWHNGPKKTDTLPGLQKCIPVLSSAFNSFIKEGRSKTTVSQKDGPKDLVTEIDCGVEMLFRMWMARHYASHKIIGEEGFKDSIDVNDYIWYIDPVDGTTNYVNQRKEVSLLISCFHLGKPLLSCIGLPFEDQLLISSSYSKEKISLTDNLIIGTEYRAKNQKEEDIYNSITKKLKAKKYRLNSIGINLLGLLDKKCMAFYKRNLKVWDAMAPLAEIYFRAKDLFEMEIYVPNNTKKIGYKVFPPFSNEPDYNDWLNSRYQKDCRIGHLVVTPKNRPDIRKVILESILS